MEPYGNPQSRNETILQNILGADYEMLPPESRIEILLQAILEQGSGGGGGGTTNYEALTNKPAINGVTLEGDQTTADLGIDIPEVDAALSSTSENALQNKTIYSQIYQQLYSTIAGLQNNAKGSMELYAKNLNNIVTSGFYNAMECTNAAFPYMTLIVAGYYLAGYCTQIACDVTTGKYKFRTQTDGTWSEWTDNVFDSVSTISNELATKVDKVAGKGLSTEDYTTAEKTKLATLSNYDDSALDARVTALEEALANLNALTYGS